jgi:sporulation protein YlmC with PRC-barrel domain
VASTINVVAGIATMMCMASLSAQTERPQERTRTGQPGTTGQAGVVQDRDAATPSARNLVKASELLGKDIKNREDKDMGDISELALDVRTGRVAYAVISFGGFLGIGDKLVAVPFQVLQPSADGKHMILDVPKEKLETAPRFDKKEWPDMDDETWGREIHTFYGVEPYWIGQPLGMGRRDGTGRDTVGRDTTGRDMAGRDRLGRGVEDASAMKEKFDRNTVTTVVGKIVSIDRPLGSSMGTEGRTGAGTGEPEERTGGRTGGERTGDVKQPIGQTGHAATGNIVQITLRTEGGATGDEKGEVGRTGAGATGSTVKVLLGPSTFLDTQHLNLAANDQVTVKGSKVDKDGQQCIIATEIRKLDQVVRLRDENGTPLWTGHAATPPTGGRNK